MCMALKDRPFLLVADFTIYYIVWVFSLDLCSLTLQKRIYIALSEALLKLKDA